MEKSSILLTKEQILIATEDTLRRYGVAKTSVTDIAKALNVSQGTLYRYYKNKNELLEAATEEWLNEKIIKPLAEVRNNAKESGFQQLILYLQTLIELKHHYARQDEELFEMYAKVTKESSRLIGQHIDHIMEHMSDIIVQSDMNVTDPAQLARTLFYATTRFHHPAHAYEWNNSSIHDEFLDIMNLIQDGINNKQ